MVFCPGTVPSAHRRARREFPLCMGLCFFCIVPIDDITAASRKCIGLSYRGIRILAFFAGGFCYSGLIITFVGGGATYGEHRPPICSPELSRLPLTFSVDCVSPF